MKRITLYDDIILEEGTDVSAGSAHLHFGYDQRSAGHMTSLHLVLTGNEEIAFRSCEDGVEVDLYLTTDRLNRLAPMLMRIEGEQTLMEKIHFDRRLDQIASAPDVADVEAELKRIEDAAGGIIPGQSDLMKMLEDDELQRLAEEDQANRAAAAYDREVEEADAKAEGLR